jgi:hypothetical protein
VVHIASFSGSKNKPSKKPGETAEPTSAGFFIGLLFDSGDGEDMFF